jgi:hypothetical protein
VIIMVDTAKGVPVDTRSTRKRPITSARLLFAAAALQLLCGFPAAIFAAGDLLRLDIRLQDMAVWEPVLVAAVLALLGCWALRQPRPPTVIGLGAYGATITFQGFRHSEFATPAILAGWSVVLALLFGGVWLSIFQTHDSAGAPAADEAGSSLSPE